MSIEKNNVHPGAISKKNLLDALAIDIANKFGTKKEKALQLLQSDISKGLNELKKEIQISDDDTLKDLKNNELEKLFFVIKGALELIEKSSQIEIKVLKEDIEKSTSVEDFKNNLEDYLPPKLLNIAKNPQAPHEHILGFTLGTTNSIIQIIDVLYQIGKGIIKTPLHIYMIVTGKAKTDSFKDV